MRAFHGRLWPLLLVLSALECYGQRIAVIGGGIAGTFFAKFIAEYNALECQLDELTLFDPYPIGEAVLDSASSGIQGSRHQTYEFDDPKSDFSLAIDLGPFSVIHEGFPYVLDVINQDPNLQATSLEPGDSIEKSADSDPLEGQAAYRQLENPREGLFYSVKPLLEVMGWPIARNVTLDEGFFAGGSYGSYLQFWWPFTHFLSKVKILLQAFSSMFTTTGDDRNNVQKHVAATEELAQSAIFGHPRYYLESGSRRLLESAFHQAKLSWFSNCPFFDENSLKVETAVVGTVVGGIDGFELFASNGSRLGHFDMVVLAVPFALCDINFLVKSHMDEAALLPMPLGGLIRHYSEDGEEELVSSDHEGHAVFAPSLPKIATRPYPRITTTIVRQGKWNEDVLVAPSGPQSRFLLLKDPNSMSDTGVTNMEVLSLQEGLFKIQSTKELSKDTISLFFGDNAKVVVSKTWRGISRRANAGPPEDDVSFLLYDGAHGNEGATISGALYYPNAMEAIHYNMEMIAIGSKAVAKLIAKRLGWLDAIANDPNGGDEL